MKCFKCGKEPDGLLCNFDNKEHEYKPHNIFHFGFSMPLNPAQEEAWHKELDRIETANDGSDPMYYENEVIPVIKELFFTFLKENDGNIYDADTKLVDEELEELSGRN